MSNNWIAFIAANIINILITIVMAVYHLPISIFTNFAIGALSYIVCYFVVVSLRPYEG